MTDHDPKGSMNADQAMASLQDIHRLQDRTREEYVRQGFRRPHSVAMFAGMILVFSGFDVPEPWERIVVPVGYAIILATLFLARRNTRVRRKTNTHEVVFTVAVVTLWFMAYLPLMIGAKLLELPAPWTLAAIVCLALLGAATRSLKRVYARGFH